MKRLFLLLSLFILCSCGKSTFTTKQVKEKYQDVYTGAYDKDNDLLYVDYDKDQEIDYIITLDSVSFVSKYLFDKIGISNEFFIYTDNSVLLVVYQ